MDQYWGFLGGIANAISLLGVMATLFVFIAQSRRAARVEQQENYLRLELASNDLFRFEADNATALEPYNDLTKPSGPDDPAAARFARSFYFMTLNLFEISVRMRRDRTIAPEVFGSWVVWYYDTLTSWFFRQEWPDLRENYTPEIRAVFDPFVAQFDPAEDDDARKRRFFDHVGKTIHCNVVRKWLD